MARYLCGLDLGQSFDFTAFVVIEEAERLNDVKYYQVRHIERWRDKMYTEIVEMVLSRINKLPPLPEQPVLVIDYTGVGRPVLDMFSAKKDKVSASIAPINITGGFHASAAANKTAGMSWNVPKKDLVGALLALSGTKRFEIGPLPLRAVLERELASFKVKMNRTSGHEAFEALRQGDHDDIVLACCIAAWYALKGKSRSPVGQFRVLRDRTVPGAKKQILRVVVCNQQELQTLEIDHNCLLFAIDDPVADDAPVEHKLVRLVADPIRLAFIAADPDDLKNVWAEPLEPYGTTPDNLVMNQTHGKQLWSNLLRKREPPTEVVVIADDDLARGQSVAMGVVDVLGATNSVVIFAGDLDRKLAPEEKAPCRHVFQCVKKSRGLVM